MDNCEAYCPGCKTKYQAENVRLDFDATILGVDIIFHCDDCDEDTAFGRILYHKDIISLCSSSQLQTSDNKSTDSFELVDHDWYPNLGQIVKKEVKNG